MKTMTTDTVNGASNKEFDWLLEKTSKALSKVTDDYIKDCIDNDIETLSADGAFYELVFFCMTESRARLSCKYKKK